MYKSEKSAKEDQSRKHSTFECVIPADDARVSSSSTPDEKWEGNNNNPKKKKVYKRKEAVCVAQVNSFVIYIFFLKKRNKFDRFDFRAWVLRRRGIFVTCLFGWAGRVGFKNGIEKEILKSTRKQQQTLDTSLNTRKEFLSLSLSGELFTSVCNASAHGVVFHLLIIILAILCVCVYFGASGGGLGRRGNGSVSWRLCQTKWFINQISRKERKEHHRLP